MEQACHPNLEKPNTEPRCPRCGYDLRMLEKPRCPECGFEFSWEEVNDAAEKRLASPLFEYNWRRSPLKSFIKTIGLSLMPWKLWSITPICLEPRIGPLLLLTTLSGLTYIALAFIRRISRWFVQNINDWGMYDFTSYWKYWPIKHDISELYLPCLFVIVFLLIIQLFDQTRSRYYIQQKHIIRIIIHSWIGIIIMRPLLDISFIFIWGIAQWYHGSYLYIRYPKYLLFIAATLFMLISLSSAFSMYLKIRNGWLWAILLIVFDAVLIIGLVVSVSIYHYKSVQNPLMHMLYTWNPDWWWGCRGSTLGLH